jgi:hypothetical protein
MTSKKTTANTIPTEISHEERERMVAEAAYFRAMSRGFQNGSPEGDWIEAEKDVEVILSHPPKRAPAKK